MLPAMDTPRRRCIGVIPRIQVQLTPYRMRDLLNPCLHSPQPRRRCGMGPGVCLPQLNLSLQSQHLSCHLSHSHTAGLEPNFPVLFSALSLDEHSWLQKDLFASARLY